MFDQLATPTKHVYHGNIVTMSIKSNHIKHIHFIIEKKIWTIPNFIDNLEKNLCLYSNHERPAVNMETNMGHVEGWQYIAGPLGLTLLTSPLQITLTLHSMTGGG